MASKGRETDLSEASAQSKEQCVIVAGEALFRWDLDAQSDENINKSAEYFYLLQEQILTNKGPQAIRLTQEELKSAFSDEETIYTAIDVDGQAVAVPLLVPIRCMTESFDEAFHASKYGIERVRDEFSGIYYFCGNVDLFGEAVNSEKEVDLTNVRAVVTEFETSDEHKYLELVDILSRAFPDLREETFIDPKNNKPASLDHYAGVLRVIEGGASGSMYSSLLDVYLAGIEVGDFESRPRNGAAIIDPREFAVDTEMQDHFWAFCGDQFMTLVENFPVIQEPSKEELISMLSDPSTINIVYFHEGRPITSCVFVENIENCTWLNGSYFQEKYRGKQVGYFPYLATDKEHTGNGYAGEVMALLGELIVRLNKEYTVTFECTNVSGDSVPYLVENAVKLDSRVDITMDRTAQYMIRSMILN